MLPIFKVLTQKNLYLFFALLLCTSLLSVTIAGAFSQNGSVIYAAVNNNSGHLRLLDGPEAKLNPNEHLISWNHQGPQGIQGPQGDMGEPGPVGEQGPAGAQGEPGDFSGEFSSPNGDFSITVNDEGIVLAGPFTKVTLGTTTVTLEGIVIDIAADASLNLESTVNANLKTTGVLALDAGLITLNGANRSVSGVGDAIVGTSFAGGGPVQGQIIQGSPTVMMGN